MKISLLKQQNVYGYNNQDPIICSFDGRSHKKCFFFHLGGASRDHYLEGIAPLRHWYINPNEKSSKYITSLLNYCTKAFYRDLPCSRKHSVQSLEKRVPNHDENFGNNNIHKLFYDQVLQFPNLQPSNFSFLRFLNTYASYLPTFGLKDAIKIYKLWRPDNYIFNCSQVLIKNF